MILDKWQKDFLETKGDKILCTGRQVGKSVVCALDGALYLVNNPNKTVLMIAPLERQAYALFQKTLNILVQKYPQMIKKGKDKPTLSRVFLNNGSKLYCLPVGTGGLSIRFLTIDRLYVDEASRIPPDVWTAIQPALLTTGGDSIYLSTPFGKQGEFYRCWINEDDAYKSFTRFSASSEQVMKERPLNETWTENIREKAIQKLEQAKSRMSNREYSQEYLGRFEDSLMSMFNHELIKKCMTIPRVFTNTILYPWDRFLGVDIARLGNDETTLISVYRIDREKVKMFDMEILKKELTTFTTKKILEKDKANSYKKIYLDSAGVGGGVYDMLLEQTQTKNKIVAIENARKSLDKDDKEKRRLLKEDLYANLLCLMEQGKIELFDDEDLYQSLRSVQYEYNERGDVRIFGDYTHLAEALVRCCWSIKDKSLNIWCG